LQLQDRSIEYRRAAVDGRDIDAVNAMDHGIRASR
jgi:hypothetical protein